MHYTQDAQGDWGTMQGTDEIEVATEQLAMTDDCKIFLRSWKTQSSDVLLILHGLGAHSGWFIDMGNQLAAHGLNVYAMDHRGFGRSEGFRGHIEQYQTYLDDIARVIDEICKRHPGARLYILGHSMGGIFAAHLAAKYGDKLAGVLFLNPAVADTLQVSQATRLAILWGGITKSKKYWALAAGVEDMTTNAEAVQMLNSDPYWVRAETASFWFQLLIMRMAMLNKARLITIPTFVMQAEEDKVVIIKASKKLYEAVASSKKTWKSYPGYYHDSELEENRSEMDNDIVSWIRL